MQVEATGESLRHRPPLVAGPLSEMDKDLSSPRVKIDRPVVPFRGKFIGCPYRSLPFRSRTISYEIGGKFYKWNSSSLRHRGVPFGSRKSSNSWLLSRSSRLLSVWRKEIRKRDVHDVLLNFFAHYRWAYFEIYTSRRNIRVSLFSFSQDTQSFN